jgi:hypothetical protein
LRVPDFKEKILYLHLLSITAFCFDPHRSAMSTKRKATSTADEEKDDKKGGLSKELVYMSGSRNITTLPNWLALAVTL